MNKRILKLVLVVFMFTTVLSVPVQASDPSSSALESVNLCLPQSIDFHEILAGGTVPWENHRDCHIVRYRRVCLNYCSDAPAPNNSIPKTYCCQAYIYKTEINYCPARS